MFLNLFVTQSAKAQTISSWLLSMGLVFSVATQLRLPGMPVGLGEILLLLWLLATSVARRNSHSPAVVGVLSLTVAGAILLGAGYFFTAYPEGQQRPPVLHDTQAYIFCAVLAINYARLEYRDEISLPSVLLWAFLVSSLMALVLGVVLRNWSGIDVMYQQTRWRHLSNNPNQFALLALPLPFLALHLILRPFEKQKLLMPMLLGLLALGLGWNSQSDALALAWVGGGAVAVLALQGARSERLEPPQNRPKYTRSAAALLVLLMVVGSAWQFRDVAVGVLTGAGTGVGARIGTATGTGTARGAATGTGTCNMGLVRDLPEAQQNQIRIRLCLWRNSLAAIQYAPLSGLGPGPHSGFTKPFDGEEAHNTLLDWGTQAGLAGIAVLVAYFGWLLWQVASRRHYELAAMLLALYSFAMFHYVLRQPLFWMVPLLALQLALRLSTGDSDAKRELTLTKM